MKKNVVSKYILRDLRDCRQRLYVFEFLSFVLLHTEKTPQSQHHKLDKQEKYISLNRLGQIRVHTVKPPLLLSRSKEETIRSKKLSGV